MYGLIILRHTFNTHAAEPMAILQLPGVCNNITGLRYIWLSDYFTTK